MLQERCRKEFVEANAWLVGNSRAFFHEGVRGKSTEWETLGSILTKL